MVNEEKPSYVVAAEHEEAALQEKQERLFALRDAGKLDEETFGKRYRRLLERQVVNEHVLKGMRLRWDVERWEAEDRRREAAGPEQAHQAGAVEGHHREAK